MNEKTYIDGLRRAVQIASSTSRGKIAAIAILREVQTEKMRQEIAPPAPERTKLNLTGIRDLPGESDVVITDEVDYDVLWHTEKQKLEELCGGQQWTPEQIAQMQQLQQAAMGDIVRVLEKPFSVVQAEIAATITPKRGFWAMMARIMGKKPLSS